MKKYLLLASCLFLFGCSEEKVESKPSTEAVAENVEDKKEETKIEVKEETKSLSNLIDHFKENGFEIGETTGKAFDMLGAVNGFGIKLNGEDVEFYEYDLSNLTEETEKNLEDVKTIGLMSMSGFSFPAEINDKFIMINHDEHTDNDKLIEVFKKY